MKAYLDLVSHVLSNGELREDRTGTGTLSVFGYQLRVDLREGFPLVTTKKIIFRSVLAELLWFLAGSTNIHDGLADKTSIWNPWADKEGNLGPIYGYQWRNWEQYQPDGKGGYQKIGIDQIKAVIDMIKTQPQSRRLLVSAWNVADIDKMALPPCHSFFQFYVHQNYLDCQLYQRSADVALGVPFNIASYSLLLMMIAQECELIPRYFIHTFGDAHVYQNHVEGLKDQLTRTPQPRPKVVIAKKPIFELTESDFELKDYNPQPFIKFPIAV